MLLRTAAGVAAVAALAGCAASHRAAVPDGPISASAVAATRHGHAVVYAVADARWTAVPLPHLPAAGASVAGHGSSIYAATLGTDGVALDSSRDGGRTWQRRQLAPTPDVAAVQLALSPDGSQLAVMIDRATSGGTGGTASLLVGPAGGALVARPVPVAGRVAWWHGRLALSGGVLSSRLYLGDATRATWTPVPVEGRVAPPRDVDPATPSVGAPAALPDGALLVPVTSHTSPSVDLLTTTDGRTFRSMDRVPLSGQLGAGTSAPVGVLPDGHVVVSDPNTLRFTVVGGRSFAPSGLPAPPSTLTFATAQLGLAEVDRAGCAQGKSGCSVRTDVYATSDGGATWYPAP